MSANPHAAWHANNSTDCPASASSVCPAFHELFEAAQTILDLAEGADAQRRVTNQRAIANARAIVSGQYR